MIQIDYIFEHESSFGPGERRYINHVTSAHSSTPLHSTLSASEPGMLSGMILDCELLLDYRITDDIDIMFEEKWRRSIRDYLTNLTPGIFLLYNALFDAAPFRSECFEFFLLVGIGENQIQKPGFTSSKPGSAPLFQWCVPVPRRSRPVRSLRSSPGFPHSAHAGMQP